MSFLTKKIFIIFLITGSVVAFYKELFISSKTHPPVGQDKSEDKDISSFKQAKINILTKKSSDNFKSAENIGKKVPLDLKQRELNMKSSTIVQDILNTMSQFETLSENEIDKFLSENEIGYLDSQYLSSLPSFDLDKDLPELFEGIFQGTALISTAADLAFSDKPHEIILALEGKISLGKYFGLQEMHIFNKRKERIGKLVGKGNLSNEIKTDPQFGVNIIYSDGSSNGTTFYQLFLSKSADMILGNIYFKKSREEPTEKIGTLKLIRVKKEMHDD